MSIGLFGPFGRTGPPTNLKANFLKMQFFCFVLQHFPCIIAHCYTERTASLNTGKSNSKEVRSAAHICIQHGLHVCISGAGGPGSANCLVGYRMTISLRGMRIG